MPVPPLAQSPCGHFVPIPNGHRAFVPDPLPPTLEMTPSLVNQFDQATRAVATLAGVGETMPNPHLLIRPFLRREAVLSSRIEGTQVSLSDVFSHEAGGARRPRNDVREVINYVRAVEHGIQSLNALPISVRLVNDVHRVLLKGVRGQEKRPGELRPDQVWIGSAGTLTENARFIPPPASMVRDLMENWERFANNGGGIPPLVQCALLHYQFEAVHPYLDGNGRIGRLLIVLFLRAKGILPTPLLYLSAYFERDRHRYYDHLLNVSAHGDWVGWVAYFLEGVAKQAQDALRRARRIRELQDTHRRLLQQQRASGNTLRLLDEPFANP